jgi:hypothetical protein
MISHFIQFLVISGHIAATYTTIPQFLLQKKEGDFFTTETCRIVFSDNLKHLIQNGYLDPILV